MDTTKVTKKIFGGIRTDFLTALELHDKLKKWRRHLLIALCTKVGNAGMENLIHFWFLSLPKPVSHHWKKYLFSKALIKAIKKYSFIPFLLKIVGKKIILFYVWYTNERIMMLLLKKKRKIDSTWKPKWKAGGCFKLIRCVSTCWSGKYKIFPCG